MKIICEKTCEQEQPVTKGKGWALLSTALLLFMPKCALCWAAYMSFLGSLGLSIRYRPWFQPLMLALFVLAVCKLLFSAIRNRNWLVLMMGLLAAFLAYRQQSVPGMNAEKWLAMTLMALALSMDNLQQLVRLLKLNKIF